MELLILSVSDAPKSLQGNTPLMHKRSSFVYHEGHLRCGKERRWLFGGDKLVFEVDDSRLIMAAVSHCNLERKLSLEVKGGENDVDTTKRQPTSPPTKAESRPRAK